MKLKDVLDIIDDETWIRIVLPDGGTIYVWGADWIGGYAGTEEMVSPWCEYDADDLCIEEGVNPEREEEMVHMLSVHLYDTGLRPYHVRVTPKLACVDVYVLAPNEEEARKYTENKIANREITVPSVRGRANCDISVEYAPEMYGCENLAEYDD